MTWLCVHVCMCMGMCWAALHLGCPGSAVACTRVHLFVAYEVCLCVHVHIAQCCMFYLLFDRTKSR